MPTNIIMPALEMAQETGKILRWLKTEGASISKGEPIMEIETDKVTVEIESPGSGILANITAHEGDVVPVGQTIAWLVAPGESAPSVAPAIQSGRTIPNPVEINASPVARKIAEEHGIDLARVKPGGGRIEKADVMAFIASLSSPVLRTPPSPSPEVQEREKGDGGKWVRSSPKARRLANERGVDLSTLRGSGLDGAVIVADIPIAPTSQPPALTTDHS
ncbi:partial Dihydrolipoyllysine-residue succinyltransferase component of 2-oxoglutarate dehydrogenase complex, partial [Anaerolineae bacterium]